MGSERLSKEDVLARFICEDHGFTCEAWPVGQKGDFRVAIYKNGELQTIRKLVFKYAQTRYALYESYRAIAKKIIEKNG